LNRSGQFVIIVKWYGFPVRKAEPGGVDADTWVSAIYRNDFNLRIIQQVAGKSAAGRAACHASSRHPPIPSRAASKETQGRLFPLFGQALKIGELIDALDAAFLHLTGFHQKSSWRASRCVSEQSAPAAYIYAVSAR
jgi:hypothetical protein